MSTEPSSSTEKAWLFVSPHTQPIPSSVMCCGLRRDQLFSPSVVTDVSFGKSSDHLNEWKPTSHHEFGETVVSLVAEGIVTELNGRQFGQVYSSLPIHTNHSRIRRNDNAGRRSLQTQGIAASGSLFITASRQHTLFSTKEA